MSSRVSSWSSMSRTRFKFPCGTSPTVYGGGQAVSWRREQAAIRAWPWLGAAARRVTVGRDAGSADRDSLFPVRFAQLALEHLADRAPRERVAQFHVGEALGLAHALVAVFAQLGGRGRAAARSHDERDRRLAPSFARD